MAKLTFIKGGKATLFVLKHGKISTRMLIDEFKLTYPTAKRWLYWLEQTLPLEPDPNWMHGNTEARVFTLLK